MKNYNNLLEIHPELLQILEVAVKKQPAQDDPWVIVLPDRAKAVSLRQRLYAVRKKLIEEKYPGCVDFNRLEFSISRGDGSLCIYVPSWLRAVQGAIEQEGEQVKRILTPEPPQPEEEENSKQTEALKELFSIPVQERSDGQG